MLLLRTSPVKLQKTFLQHVGLDWLCGLCTGICPRSSSKKAAVDRVTTFAFHFFFFRTIASLLFSCVVVSWWQRPKIKRLTVSGKLAEQIELLKMYMESEEDDQEHPVEQISIANKNVLDIKYLRDICTRHRIPATTSLVQQHGMAEAEPLGSNIPAHVFYCYYRHLFK